MAASFDPLQPVFLPELAKFRPGAMVLTVKGVTDTWIRPRCDRCPQPFTRHLHRNPPPQDGSSPDVMAHGHFDPERWLYEQLCPGLPRRNICCQVPAPLNGQP